MKSTLLLLLAATPLFAGPMVPAHIPASATWMMHADMDAMRDSETGRHLFTRIEGEHGARLRAMKRMFAVHPLQDLRGVTLYGDGRPDRAVALIDGSLDRAHLEDIVRGAEDHREWNHAGYTIHSWKDKGLHQHAAFATDSLLVFSRQTDMLEAALDTLKAEVAAEGSPFFAEAGGRPLIAAGVRISEIEMPEDAARLVRMAKSLHLAANEHEGRFSLRLSAETTTPKEADQLRRMLDGVLAFAQLGDVKLDGLDLQAKLTTPRNPPSLAAVISLPIGEWLTLMDRAEAEAKALQGR